MFWQVKSAWLLLLAMGLAACAGESSAPALPLPAMWKARVTSAITRPAASDGVVFLADEASNIMAFDAKTGTKKWEKKLSLVAHEDYPLGVENGRVFAAEFGDKGRVVALDANNGTQLWESPTGKAYGNSFHPVAKNGRVFFEAAQGESYVLRAADAQTGKPLWEYALGGSLSALPVANDTLVFVGANGFDAANTPSRRLVALDASTGKEKWAQKLELNLSKALSLDGSRIYLGMNGGVVQARNAATGAGDWTTRVGGALNKPPVSAGDFVYVGTTDGKMVALKAADGSQAWELNVGSAILTLPAAADGIVYFGANNGFAYAADALTGKKLWEAQSPERKPFAQSPYVPPMSTTPVWADGALFYFNTDNLYALSAR